MINHVREYREYKGVSLRWLARKVGCGASTISAIERGEMCSQRVSGAADRKGAGDDRGEFVGGRAVTETEWRTYLLAEIARLLAAANDRALELTAMLLRRLTKQ